MTKPRQRASMIEIERTRSRRPGEAYALSSVREKALDAVPVLSEIEYVFVSEPAATVCRAKPHKQLRAKERAQLSQWIEEAEQAATELIWSRAKALRERAAELAGVKVEEE